MLGNVNITSLKFIYFFLFFFFLAANNAAHSFFEDIEFEGELSLSGRYFPSAPEYSGQKHNNLSMALKPEFFTNFEEHGSLVFTPFIRLDNTDPNRSKIDFREFLYTNYGNDWEASIGIGQIFWGVTESKNLVDIVNQFDEVDDPFYQTKLGQPLGNITLIRDEGYFEFYILPYFRERPRPGKKGRLRTDPHFLKRNAKFEGGSQWTPEFAFRWLNTYEDIDISTHAFLGYAREPSIDLRIIDGITNYGAAYQRIRQLGGTLQKTTGATLYKLELITRDGQRDSSGKITEFLASVFGFEHTLYRVFGDQEDLALILEYNFDSRRDKSSDLLQDDLFIATRFSFNDSKNSEIFVSSTFDLDGDGQTYQFDLGRRINDSLTGTIRGAIYQNGRPSSTIYILRQDSWLELELKYYF